MVFLGMKRTREEGETTTTAMTIDNITMANYLMLLSRGGGGGEAFEASMMTTGQYSSPSRVFECKTCNRQFPSFQALGGHRASHKKPRLMMGSSTTTDGENNQTLVMHDQPPVKPKTHECSICGLEFAIGQALGGHMRRHRANNISAATTPLKMISLLPPIPIQQQRGVVVPVMKKSNSRRFMCLDLNLTPLENDFKVWV